MKNLFLEFCKTFEGESILGYELVSDSDSMLSALLRSDLLNKEFQVFLEDPVGSGIAFWKLENGEERIVYFNSEGSPFAVIAKDFSAFLALLYYGSYAPLEIEQYLNYQRRKANYERLGAEFTKKEPTGMSSVELAEIKERLKSEYSNYDVILQWLEKHQITCPSSPYFEVVKAYEESPNLSEYIDSKLD